MIIYTPQALIYKSFLRAYNHTHRSSMSIATFYYWQKFGKYIYQNLTYNLSSNTSVTGGSYYSYLS